ncbi:MAG: GNAT family N-acetyltransferase [Burkholderiales bacterium]|nr:GNAT family N-acetyltransferase [Bacteroidia bacterium]
MDSLIIREVELNDLESLRQISIQTFTETFSEHNTESNMKEYITECLNTDKLKQELQTIGSSFYFALLGQQIIGYLKLNTAKAQTEHHSEDGFEIERIYVLKAFHGKQIGKILFEKAKSIALEKQYKTIWLGVWEKNTKAIAFYTRQGFTQFDHHLFKLGNDKQTDILMELKIN